MEKESNNVTIYEADEQEMLSLIQSGKLSSKEFSKVLKDFGAKYPKSQSELADIKEYMKKEKDCQCTIEPKQGTIEEVKKYIEDGMKRQKESVKEYQKKNKY